MVNQYLVDSPYSPFTIKNQFKAISNGKVYIGEVDKDPLNPSQQIQVYVVDETGSNVPVSQPIQLNAGGYLVYNGQVSKFVTLEPYSMVVLNNVNAEMWRVDDISKVDPDNITASNVRDTTNGGSVQDFIDDYDGFTANLLYNGGIVDDGQPDTPSSSKRVDAMYNIFSTKSQSNKGIGTGVYVESLLEGDARKIAGLGINYVIYLYHPTLIGVSKALDDIRELATYGVNVFFSLFGVEDAPSITTLVNAIKNEPNVVCWYLYDEPDGFGITVAAQEQKIGLVNTLSGLPCAVSANSDFGPDRRLSKLFDYYFISRYISDADYVSKTTDEVILFFLDSMRYIGADVGLHKCIPIHQAYTQGAVSVQSREDTIRIWKLGSRSYSNPPCFFLWSANATQPSGFANDIASDSELQSYVATFIGLQQTSPILQKVSAQAMFSSQDGAPITGDASVLQDAMSIFDLTRSVGQFGVSPFFAGIPSLSGYYPNFDGITVIDLGIKASKLSIRFRARNDRDGNLPNVEIGEYYTLGGGKVLESISAASNAPIVREYSGLNCRYVYIKMSGAFLNSTYNGYLSVVEVQFSAIQ